MSLDILLLAGFAIFIGYWLYTVLGRRTGNERPPFDPVSRRERLETRNAPVAAAEDNVVQLPRARELSRAAEPVAATGPLGAGLQQIKEADKSFEADAFLRGASVAHEMIARAFAAGDRQTLRPLLAEDVYSSFDAAIAEREKASHKLEFSFVGLKQAKLEEATLRGRIAEITVRFVSELISATRDAAGAVIEGAAGAVREVTDVWTFARDTKSADPNWKLVATAGG